MVPVSGAPALGQYASLEQLTQDDRWNDHGLQVDCAGLINSQQYNEICTGHIRTFSNEFHVKKDFLIMYSRLHFANLLLHTPLPWRLQSCNLLTAYSELHTQHAPSVANAVMTFPNIPRQLRYDTMIDLWRLRSLAVGSNSIVVSSGELW